MKNTILTLLIAITVLNANSQDVITKKDGTDINVKVKEITIDAVKYLNFDNQNGPLYTISKTDIFRIKYETGNIENFVKTNISSKPISVTELEKKVDLIIYNNNKHHKAYQVGKILIIAGSLIGLIGGIESSLAITIVGFVGQISGAIIEWDSHKWFSSRRNKGISNDMNIVSAENEYKNEYNQSVNIVGYFDNIFNFSKDNFIKGQFVKINTRSEQYFGEVVEINKLGYLTLKFLENGESFDIRYKGINKARILTESEVSKMIMY